MFYEGAIERELMQVSLLKRTEGKNVILASGQEVTEFINCSYLGLDRHPTVVSAYRSVDPSWGVNFSCARSRFTPEPIRNLEEKLSVRYRGRAITFPSVTTTHVAVMPLISAGLIWPDLAGSKIRFLFDRYSHISMAFLKPLLATDAEIRILPHNDLEALKTECQQARNSGFSPVYVGDGIYSMGGVAPIREILQIAETTGLSLYIDDAHGTTILGERGEGAVMSQLEGDLPRNMVVAFSLSKGFGANGGGILLPSTEAENNVRKFGLIYGFSSALDLAVVQACHAILDLHNDGTVKLRQKNLREITGLFDHCTGLRREISPIRMIPIGDEGSAIEHANALKDAGYFTSVAFFPIVPKGEAQLRISLAATHTEDQILGLVKRLRFQGLLEYRSNFQEAV
jgi:7-keto-8-aminopelargonate synthetase-like enzyme